jgi:hypothetical protein
MSSEPDEEPTGTAPVSDAPDGHDDRRRDRAANDTEARYGDDESPA